MQIHRPKTSSCICGHVTTLPHCRDASRHFVGEYFCCETDALHADDRKQLKYISVLRITGSLVRPSVLRCRSLGMYCDEQNTRDRASACSHHSKISLA